MVGSGSQLHCGDGDLDGGLGGGIGGGCREAGSSYCGEESKEKSGGGGMRNCGGGGGGAMEGGGGINTSFSTSSGMDSPLGSFTPER